MGKRFDSELKSAINNSEELYPDKQMANNFYNINIRKYNPAEHQQHYQSEVQQLELQQTEGDTVQSYQAPDTTQEFQGSEQPSHSRLNALDSTILVNESYHNLEDSDFKTEYHISKLESDLKSLENEIERAKAINDYQKVDVLIMRRHAIQAKLAELNEDYVSGDVAAKISGDITAIFSNKKPNFLTKTVSKCVNFMSSKVLPKISKKYNSGLEIKTALSKLETLNKNVDELVTMQMPYGEADERYDMLSGYLNRANVIHFNISKTVGTPTFFDTISSIDKEKLGMAKIDSSNFGNMTSKPNMRR